MDVVLAPCHDYTGYRKHIEEVRRCFEDIDPLPDEVRNEAP